METIQIKKENALAAYKNADKKTKELLENLFGKSLLYTNIMDRIKSFEDACEVVGADPEDLPYKNPKNAREEAVNAFHMLDIISEALLEGKVLDWTDSDQPKYYPWFNNYKPGSGFRFNATTYVWTYALASGGARLCLDTEEKAKYFGTQFLDIWNKFQNPNK